MIDIDKFIPSLGSVDYCDEEGEDYDPFLCDEQLDKEDKEKKDNGNGIFNFLNNVLVAFGANSDKRGADNKTNSQTPAKNSQTMTFEQEKAMFDALTKEQKKMYAKNNPTSLVVKNYLSKRFWTNVGIGAAGVAGATIVGIVVVKLWKTQSE